MKPIKLFILCLLWMLRLQAQDAQFAPFRGGQADGHSATRLNNFTADFTIMFAPYAGSASGDGYSSDSILQFNPLGATLAFAPFSGGSADGYSSDSLNNFNARGYINMFSPFGGGTTADGYAYDSLIAFNPRNYIGLYTPFAGGISDGYHEGVLCNFPRIEGDTSVFLLCSNDAINLDSLVFNYNFAARWNTTRPDSAVAGVYELRINNAGKCLDTATVNVKLDVVRWTGTADNNWHNTANWNTGSIPTEVSHVIIPGGTPHPCEIFEQDAEAASVQARTGSVVRTIGSRVLVIGGTCAVLPIN